MIDAQQKLRLEAVASVQSDPLQQFQRAPQAPDLPATPLRFICYFVGHFRYWYLAMVLFETAHAVCSICLPYAVSRVIKGVTESGGQAQATVAALRTPLLLFVLLSVGEVVFARAGGTCQILTGPRQRQNVTRRMYAYLQHHSHRFLSNNFAGALAHKREPGARAIGQRRVRTYRAHAGGAQRRAGGQPRARLALAASARAGGELSETQRARRRLDQRAG